MTCSMDTVTHVEHYYTVRNRHLCVYAGQYDSLINSIFDICNAHSVDAVHSMCIQHVN